MKNTAIFLLLFMAVRAACLRTNDDSSLSPSSERRSRSRSPVPLTLDQMLQAYHEAEKLAKEYAGIEENSAKAKYSLLDLKEMGGKIVTEKIIRDDPEKKIASEMGDIAYHPAEGTKARPADVSLLFRAGQKVLVWTESKRGTSRPWTVSYEYYKTPDEKEKAQKLGEALSNQMTKYEKDKAYLPLPNFKTNTKFLDTSSDDE